MTQLAYFKYSHGLNNINLKNKDKTKSNDQRQRLRDPTFYRHKY